MTAPVNERIVNTDGSLASRWLQWVQRVDQTIEAARHSGTTANRPTRLLWVGRTYFDTTLGKPVWYDGSGWVDATGTTA